MRRGEMAEEVNDDPVELRQVQLCLSGWLAARTISLLVLAFFPIPLPGLVAPRPTQTFSPANGYDSN